VATKGAAVCGNPPPVGSRWEGLDRKWWTLIAVCTAILLLLLDITVVNVALPDIQLRIARLDPARRRLTR
jgi:hypothetical protein